MDVKIRRFPLNWLEQAAGETNLGATDSPDELAITGTLANLVCTRAGGWGHGYWLESVSPQNGLGEENFWKRLTDIALNPAP